MTHSPERNYGRSANGQPTAARDRFGAFATETARLTAKPGAFLGVLALVSAWGLVGPIFNFSTDWILFINTVMTVVTGLMVFLIQNAQNRGTLAIQLKLAELILVIEGTENKMALAEDLSHKELEEMKEDLRGRSELKK